jgi:hypothetical protein
MSTFAKVSVRIRPKKPNINERLSTFSGTISQLKGSLSDVKVEMVEESKLFSDEYKVSFIPVLQNSDYNQSLQPLAIYYNKGNNFLGFEPKKLKADGGLILMLNDAIIKYATLITGNRGKGEDPKDFFEIVQNPWKNEPPTYRYFGQDKWLLNNESSILIKWQPQNTTPKLLDFDNMVSGRQWSNEDGSERESELGLTGSAAETSKVFKINLVKSVVIFGGEFTKSPTENFTAESNPQDIFTITTDNKFSKTGTPVSWPGSVKDIDIIGQVLDTWKSNITGYSKLGVCSVQARYPGNVCNQLIYVSPLEPDLLGPDVNLENKVGLSGGSPSGATPSVGTASVTKIPMNIVLPKDIEIKVREDVPDIFVYVGEKPSETDPFEGVEGFVFEGEEFVPLDEEYTEVSFLGEGESINTPEEELIEESLSQETDKKVEENIQNGAMQNVSGALDPKLHGSTPYSTTTKVPPGFNNVPLYHQGESRFATILYDRMPNGKKCTQKDGSKSTIKTSGCGVCAITMVMNWWASKGYIKPVTIKEVADFFSDVSGRGANCVGSAYGAVNATKFKEKFGIIIKNATDADLMKSLKAGYPCAISGKNYVGLGMKGGKVKDGSPQYSNGHFICLTGIDSEGRVRINDSGRNPTGGNALTAFLPGKTPVQSRTPTSSMATFYPASMSKPPWD